MVSIKSLDEVEIIAALLNDVQPSYGVVFNTRALRLTLQKMKRRAAAEGMSFLTKTLPRLGKAFDKALSGDTPLNCTKVGFKPYRNTKLPSFLGELFNSVLLSDGTLRPIPCAQSVMDIRQILYLFYKYELPYSEDQEQQVIAKFERTEQELITLSPLFAYLRENMTKLHGTRRYPSKTVAITQAHVAREASYLLQEVFAFFDPNDIYPRHGPGAVATKQKLWDKYSWTNVCSRISDYYPLDAFFQASAGHVCDEYDKYKLISDVDLPARVVLVPKDSRGPRLISCEPVDFQWIQQGLSRAIVELVESHVLTKDAVHFTDQGPNRCGAQLGSMTGGYVTLDLNEASDRVSLDLVRLLFPEHIYMYLEACRSRSTVLPNGKVLALSKFAPMGSSLCFPILALSIWAILAAAAPDAYTRERILVYGDDVIVPTAYAANAIEQLESFGLKVNRDKSCISGLFRESCGMDAFAGVNVTPVRLRTVWSSAPSPDVYSSWIAYANSFYDRRYYRTYDYIVSRLIAVYGPIPDEGMQLACPSLRVVPDGDRPRRKRVNSRYQKLQFRVWDLKAPTIRKEMSGWSMLLRFFAESGASRPPVPHSGEVTPIEQALSLLTKPAFSVRSYTSRRTSMLVRRWR